MPRRFPVNAEVRVVAKVLADEGERVHIESNGADFYVLRQDVLSMVTSDGGPYKGPFEVGDVVSHIARPEWGMGVVVGVQKGHTDEDFMAVGAADTEPGQLTEYSVRYKKVKFANGSSIWNTANANLIEFNPPAEKVSPKEA